MKKEVDPKQLTISVHAFFLSLPRPWTGGLDSRSSLTRHWLWALVQLTNPSRLFRNFKRSVTPRAFGRPAALTATMPNYSDFSDTPEHVRVCFCISGMYTFACYRFYRAMFARAARAVRKHLGNGEETWKDSERAVAKP